MTDQNSPPNDPRPLISARGSARRPLLGRGLLIAGIILAVAGVVMAAIAPWSELSELRANMQKRVADQKPMRFVVPGNATFDLPEGRIFVAYLTDTEFEGTRYLASSELIFELTVTDADGQLLAIEYETTQRANLPSSRPGKPSTAVLVGAVTIPTPGPYDISLVLGENESSSAVSDVFVVQEDEIEMLNSAFQPVLAAFCGLGGGGFLSLLGGITIWLEKRARAASLIRFEDQ